MAASKEPESERWEQISELSSNVLSEVRDLSHTLRPPVLDSLGLTRALHSMATQLTDSAGLVCEIALEDIDDLLPPEAEISLFRSAQELIGNAVRHSHGATIKLLAKPIGNQVLLRVSDDGCGYNPQRLAKRGLGINSVRERVGLLGGEYDVDTAPQQGTRVTIRIPVPEPPLGSEERQRQQSQRQRLAFASGLALVAMVFGTFYLLLSGRMDDAAAQQAEVESARTAIHQALGLPSVIPAQPTPSPDGGKTNIPPNRKTSATRRTPRFRPG
jgi:two-component sensor histidine kinase